MNPEGEMKMKRASHPLSLALLIAILTSSFSIKASAQSSLRNTKPTARDATPDANTLLDDADKSSRESEMRPTIEYYVVDRGSLLRSYPVSTSPARQERFRKFYSDALLRIQNLDFDSMSQEGKVD